MPACPKCSHDNPAGKPSCEVCGFQLLPPDAGRRTRVEPPAGQRVTRMEPTGGAPQPPPTPVRSAFDRPPTRPSGGGGVFDRPPQATPPRRTVVAPISPTPQPTGEPIAGVLVAYRSPSDPGVLHVLRHGQNTIGRNPSNHVVLDDETVSEHHGFVFLDPSGAEMRYLDTSTNGTLVDGNVVRFMHADLVAGTTMLVGGTVLVFSPIPKPDALIWARR